MALTPEEIVKNMGFCGRCGICFFKPQAKIFGACGACGYDGNN